MRVGHGRVGTVGSGNGYEIYRQTYGGREWLR